MNKEIINSSGTIVTRRPVKLKIVGILMFSMLVLAMLLMTWSTAGGGGSAVEDFDIGNVQSNQEAPWIESEAM